MNAQNLMQLPQLQPDSGLSLSNNIINGLRASASGGLAMAEELITELRQDGSGTVWGPAHSATLFQNLISIRKVMTIRDPDHGLVASLNKELEGGDSYSNLSTVLSIGTGLIPGVGTAASLLFTAVSAAIDLGRRTSNVLARNGDDIYHVERIGRVLSTSVLSRSQWIPTHISAWFLYDPFRMHQPIKGRLLSEVRRELTLG